MSSIEVLEDGTKPFDSFSLVIKTLKWVGYYDISKDNTHLARVCHRVYRLLVFAFVVVYNIQHIIFIANTNWKDTALWDSLMIEIPQAILLSKIITIILNSSRIENLNNVIKEPIFSARSDNDIEYLKRNKAEMFRLQKIIYVSVACGASLWILSNMFRRLENPAFVVPMYFPFSTESWTGFTFSVLLEVCPVIWVGVGHLALDCLVATYYSQATVQIKILKYNLEHIFDTEEDNSDERVRRRRDNARLFQYKDVGNEKFHKDFVFYVDKYEKIIWFIEEINNVFDKGMSFQFFTTSVSNCLAIYNMSMMNVFSITFLFMVSLIFMFQFQVFFYCLYGHLVQYESQTVNTAIYFSDWMSVSPRFRRQILIAMSRWHYPLTPQVLAIVPVSLTTFVTIIRSAYAMYTVMKSIG